MGEFLVKMKLVKKIIRKINEKIADKEKKEKFRTDLELLKSSINEPRFALRNEDFWKCLNDSTSTGLAGFDMHYVYHTSWAARKLSQIMPEKHVDISSYLYFSLIVSAFVPVDFYDYRPVQLNLPNLESKHANITNLPFEDNSIKSLSCMHVVEHIGLGRYGDPVNYNSDLKAINELKRVIAPKGSLLFVVPVGKEAKIQFNAHRIYTKEQILDYFSGFKLLDFAFIKQNGEGGLLADIDNSESYGCGCFWLRK